jgi:hypothetical protein|tara:strand:- start:547 stop:765 length:219 start_codon:yes stop_codon:yes gene_type:complete
VAEFQLVVNGILETYTKYEDIPDTFENVIKFLPDLPEPEGEDGNHTDEQHAEMARWNGRLQALMEKERARGN